MGSLATVRETTIDKKASEFDEEVDEETLVRAQDGDQKAFRVIVERYENQVFALFSRFFSSYDSQFLEDLAQETFLRLFRHIHRFRTDGEAKLSTWILTIATRLAIDEQRKQKRLPNFEDENRIEAPEYLDPEACAETRLLAERIRKAVSHMNEEQRIVLILRAYHDLDYVEIASALGCDIGTVKSRLSRARKVLRDFMDGGSDEE